MPLRSAVITKAFGFVPVKVPAAFAAYQAVCHLMPPSGQCINTQLLWNYPDLHL